MNRTTPLFVSAVIVRTLGAFHTVFILSVLGDEFFLGKGEHSGEQGRGRIKNTIILIYFKISKFLGYGKKINDVQGQASTRGEGVYQQYYVPIQTISFRLDMKTRSLFSTVHISFFLVNFELPFIITNPPIFAKGSSLFFKASNLLQMQ